MKRGGWGQVLPLRLFGVSSKQAGSAWAGRRRRLCTVYGRLPAQAAEGSQAVSAACMSTTETKQTTGAYLWYPSVTSGRTDGRRIGHGAQEQLGWAEAMRITQVLAAAFGHDVHVSGRDAL